MTLSSLFPSLFSRQHNSEPINTHAQNVVVLGQGHDDLSWTQTHSVRSSGKTSWDMEEEEEEGRPPYVHVGYITVGDD